MVLSPELFVPLYSFFSLLFCVCYILEINCKSVVLFRKLNVN